MKTEGDLTAIVVNWNTRELLRKCLDSFFSQTRGVAYEVWVVDNGSTDNSSEMVRKKFPQVRLIENESNLGFSQANNQAIRRSSGRYVLLLNSDTELIGNAPRILAQFMDDHPEAGAAGCKLLNSDGSLQLSCGRFPRLFSALMGGVLANSVFKKFFPNRRFFAEYGLSQEEHSRLQETDFVMGACMILRREALEQAGFFDEDIFLYFEEIDLCYRIKQAGWKILYTPEARVCHHGGQSSPSSAYVVQQNLISLEYFFRKHYSRTSAVILRILMFLGSASKIVIFMTLLLVPRIEFRKMARARLSWHVYALRYYLTNFFELGHATADAKRGP
jgi:GT2 family glycosyltransferase